MNIISQTDNKICIELSKEDMAELDITYEELDYENTETKRVIWTLLDIAGRRLGKDLNLSRRMIIEALPSNNGGCIMFLTITNKPAGTSPGRIIKTGRTVICQSAGLDDIEALCRVLSKKDNGDIVKSELFTDGKNYRLLIQPDLFSKNDLMPVLTEFCTVVNGCEAQTKEYWKQLITPDAIRTLASLR